MSAREVAERLRNRRIKAEVQTPEGTLYVRGMTGKERVAYFKWIHGDGPGEILLSDQRLLAVVLCDESGAPIFDDEESALAVLSDWNNEDVLAAAKKSLSMSGLGKDALETAEKK